MSKQLDTDEAYAHCRSIALGHYENFPVASILLPKKIRPHIYAVYAFARHADDLADEHHDRDGLMNWREMFHRSLSEGPSHPIFIALVDTIRRFSLPVQLFDDLISAFLQDLEITRYRDMEQLTDYCRRSANPVGRLVLLLHGFSSSQLFGYSDAICTALQLTNFWQDVKVDLKNDRIYIPETHLKKYQVTEQQILAQKYDQRFAGMMKELVDQTEEMFFDGLPLLPAITFRLRWELRFTIAGGLAILGKIRSLNGDTLNLRPALKKQDWLRIAFKPITANR